MGHNSFKEWETSVPWTACHVVFSPSAFHPCVFSVPGRRRCSIQQHWLQPVAVYSRMNAMGLNSVLSSTCIHGCMPGMQNTCVLGTHPWMHRVLNVSIPLYNIQPSLLFYVQVAYIGSPASYIQSWIALCELIYTFVQVIFRGHMAMGIYREVSLSGRMTAGFFFFSFSWIGKWQLSGLSSASETFRAFLNLQWPLFQRHIVQSVA